ncbi:MAG: PAS domain S-box protein, partial [Sulfuricella sp.]
MEKNLSPQPAAQAEPTRDSFRNRLLRPSLGKKLSIAFLLFFALMVGNLIFAERLYEGIADTANIVNESGRLRFLSQKIAFHSTRLVYEKHQDGKMLGQLIDEFDGKLANVERELGQLHPAIGREMVDLPQRLWTLHDTWRTYRAEVEGIRKSPVGVNSAESVKRIHHLADSMLGFADGIVNELAHASMKAHDKIDFILHAMLVAEAAFILVIFLYLRWKVILPVREISRLVSRFAAGDRSARINFKSRDEIGELARNFNQTAETVGKLIADLNRGITELEKSQEKVRKLAMVVEGTGNSVVIADRNGIIEYVNPAFTKVTGYLLEEAVGQKPGMIKSGLTSPEHYQGLWKTLLAGEEWRGEMLNRKKNGELFWEYEVITALKNEAGEITHFIAVKEDVTERKSYESQLEH